MQEIDKNVPLIVCGFHKKMRVVGVLGEKFIFFNSLGTIDLSVSLFTFMLSIS